MSSTLLAYTEVNPPYSGRVRGNKQSVGSGGRRCESDLLIVMVIFEASKAFEDVRPLYSGDDIPSRVFQQHLDTELWQSEAPLSAGFDPQVSFLFVGRKGESKRIVFLSLQCVDSLSFLLNITPP